jgi:signal peptidase II
MMSGLERRRGYILLSCAVVGLDQASKFLIDSQMRVHESRPILEGILSLTYVRNRGAAFGILSDAGWPHQSMLFSVVSLVALGAIALYSLRLPARSRLPQTALALIMGGAVGNLLDRTARGYVVDFVDVFWGSHHWPAFNVADSAISTGVGLLILDILLSPGKESAKSEIVTAAASNGRTE